MPRPPTGRADVEAPPRAYSGTVPVAPAILGLPEWADRLVIAGVVAAAAIVLLVVLGRLGPRLSDRLSRGVDPLRMRQRQTAVALLLTSLRYVVVIAAIVGAAFALAGGGIAAVGGGALVVLVVGFASQRLLTDVIAGFFILFENQYGVGDFVRLEPTGYTGMVEELGVRTTVLRDLNGDRLHVPNGQITAVRRIPRGWRSFQVELVTRDPDAIASAVAEAARTASLGGARFLAPPRVAERREVGDGLTAVLVRAEVAPSLEWLVERFLVETLAARTGELLASPPLVVSLDQRVVERYQAGLALP